MASGYWSPLAIGMADGPPIGASSGAQSCIPVTARYTFPPNSFMIGSALRITALGRYTTTTTSGTATWSVVLGGVAGVFTSGAYALNVTLAKTNLPFWLDIVITNAEFVNAPGSPDYFLFDDVTYVVHNLQKVTG
jgi:hypothetical protein